AVKEKWWSIRFSKGKASEKYRFRGVVIALKSARDKDHDNNAWGFLAYSHQGNHFLTLFF
uniref:hypothetical protein n=1 Tax=Yersinia pestis TaxID=632 RepID=UPI000576D592